jgi:hypothetical protein
MLARKSSLMKPTRVILVIELQITNPNQIAWAIKKINPPGIPHFAGRLRVAMDEFGEGADNPATAIINYLEGEGETPC